MGKKVMKEIYQETSGARMILNVTLIAGLYVLGGIAYEAGKKVLATAILAGICGVMVGQVIDGTIVQLNQNKKK